MDDRIRPELPYGAIQEYRIRQIALDEPPGKNSPVVPGRKIVIDQDLMALASECLHHVTPDVSCPSSNEDLHRSSISG